MKISQITVKAITPNKTNHQTKTNIQNNNLSNDIFVSFKGKQYPSGYYTDEQIAYAKKYLGKENWEKDLKDEHVSNLVGRMNFFKYVFTSAPEKG